MFLRKVLMITNLHSTMFLLILLRSALLSGAGKFTFHNVSINSVYFPAWYAAYSYLHSTMFLLILALQIIQIRLQLYLHSTMFLLILRLKKLARSLLFYLHSTMFLLIHSQGCISTGLKRFTFHNVSIN